MADDTQSLGPSSVGSDPAQDNAPIMQGIGGLAQGAASALPTPQVTQQNTTPPPDQPGTHSKLISMLQHGLIGLGAAGKAIATHGKEGGVSEVANIQAQEQQSQRADEELAMRKKAFSTQNALAELQLETARQNAPLETQKRIQDLKSSQLEYAQKLYPHATLVADDNDPSHGNQVLDYLKSKGLALHDVVVHHVNGVGTLVTPRTDMYGKTMTPDLADSLNSKYKALGVDGTRFKAGMDMESAEDLSKGYDAQVASTLQKAQLQAAQSRATIEGALAGVAPQVAAAQATEAGVKVKYAAPMAAAGLQEAQAKVDLTKAQVKKASQDTSTVYAVNDKGDTVLTTKGEAIEGGMKAIRSVKQADIEKDQHDIKVLNDIASKANNVIDTAGALDQGPVQKNLMARILADANNEIKIGAFGAELPTGWLNKQLEAEDYSNMTDASKKYVINVLSMREASMGMQKVLTGSARANEQQIRALQATIPGLEDSSDTAYQKSKQFTQNIDMLRQGIAKMPGMDEVKIKQPPPSNKVTHVYDPKSKTVKPLITSGPF